MPIWVGKLLASKVFWSIVGIATIVGAALFAYNSYRDLQDDIKQLETEKVTMVAQIATLEESKKTLEAASTIQSESINRLSAAVNKDRAALDKLQAKFSEHDIGFLASKKPAVIEHIIDTASKERMRCMEIAAGSEPTEDDRGNSVCPQYFPYQYP